MCTPNINTSESEKANALLIYLKSDVGRIEKDYGYDELAFLCFHCL
jgi:hypothetical protein